MESQSQKTNKNVPILLIYYNFRGIGQMIRYLLVYAKLPFLDILLDEYEKQKQSLPQAVLQTLRSKSVNKNELPAIIHNNQIIYDLNQIINYLCITFNRQDLLGINIYQKARVCEIQERFALRLSSNIKFLSGFVVDVQKSNLQDHKLLQYIEKRLTEFFAVSGYSQQLSQLLINQQDQKYVLENITIADFYYVQHCRFAVKLFGNIDEQLAQGEWSKTAHKFREMREQKGEQVRHVSNLRAMKRFIDFISSQAFYLKNQAYFQSFKFFPKSISGEQVAGMKKLHANYFLDLYYDTR